ncbi:MAG: hypothetical protein WCI79_03200, partial [Candidatus Saccharibacteria bacterium]
FTDKITHFLAVLACIPHKMVISIIANNPTFSKNQSKKQHLPHHKTTLCKVRPCNGGFYVLITYYAIKSSFARTDLASEVYVL